jgi:hypothetical protein
MEQKAVRDDVKRMKVEQIEKEMEYMLFADIAEANAKEEEATVKGEEAKVKLDEARARCENVIAGFEKRRGKNGKRGSCGQGEAA